MAERIAGDAQERDGMKGRPAPEGSGGFRWAPVAVAVGLVLVLSLFDVDGVFAVEEGGPDWKGMEIPRIVNFIVLFALLYFFLRKPIRSFFGRRRQQIADELDEARAAREAAEQKLREYENRIANLEEEKARIQQEAEEEGRRLRERLQQDTEAAVRRIDQQAQESIAQERLKAMRALRSEAAALAVELAEGLLRENLRSEDHRRLLERYIEDLEAYGRN